jgi:butyrate kinase
MQLDFTKGNGLIPAIIQDEQTLEVLMLGFMNEEAYSKTVSENKVTFFSRSKSRLWTKGEESGNFLHVKSIGSDINLIVAHLGGGISVGAHRKGKIVDVNNALDGDGPFSPERAGSLPAGDLVKLCFSGQYSQAQITRLLTGGGGLMAYLGTTDGIEIEKRIATGDPQAAEVYEAMAYQIAKEVGACAAVLEGEVDAIALTGSLVHSKTLLESLRRKIAFIAPIHLNPGENEMEALAQGVMRYFNKEEALSVYSSQAAGQE